MKLNDFLELHMHQLAIFDRDDKSWFIGKIISCSPDSVTLAMNDMQTISYWTDLVMKVEVLRVSDQGWWHDDE